MKDRGEILLALDTSISSGTLSLWRGDKEVDTGSGDSSGNRSEDILENISRLLGNNDLNRKNINFIAVSLGPGSYTGIRIGIATTLGLVASVGCKSVGVSSLLVLAQESKAGADRCLTGIWAGRDEVVSQLFNKEGLSEGPESPKLMALEAFYDLAEREKLNAVLDKRAFEALEKLRNISNRQNYQKASDNAAQWVARLGRQEIEHNRFNKIGPIYSREFSGRG